MLDRHCEEIGRDRPQILMSTSLRFHNGVDGLLAAAEKFAAEGAGLAIVGLPAPFDLDLLDRLVAALDALSEA